MIQLYFWDYLKRANMQIRKSAQNSVEIFVFSMLQIIHVFLFNSYPYFREGNTQNWGFPEGALPLKK